MPLHGKIVVVKRSGVDGTEFPLTGTCLFGRKPHCDIRIQLPEVSKEHCRIELNENKEVILTNLSSVNPTCVNGEALQQPECLKHGDIITVIDRSFRFEYPPATTPKKRPSLAGKTEKLQVLQDQQASITKSSEVTTDSYLKDGANHDNIQRSLEKTFQAETKETSSPFKDLYQMIKQTMDMKTPQKSSASQPPTPATQRFLTPRATSVRKVAREAAPSTEVKSAPEKAGAVESSAAVATNGEAEEGATKGVAGTPKSAKKQRKSLDVPLSQETGPEEIVPADQAAAPATPTQATPRNRRRSSTAATPATAEAPARRRSKEATPSKATVTEAQADPTVARPSTPKPEVTLRASPRSLERKLKAQEVPSEPEAAATSEKPRSSKKRKSEELGVTSEQQAKKKRVSFGNLLTPELFDKRLPPDSPLRKGAMPRRSLSVPKMKDSLLRRASAIGMIKESSPKGKSPAKSRTPSPAKRSPKTKTPSPRSQSPAKMSPKARTPSPSKNKSPKTKAKTPSPAKTSPARGRSPSTDKPQTPKAEKSPKPRRKSTSPAAQPQLVDKKTTKRRSCPVASSSDAVAALPSSSRSQTPSVQGRFSVSRISTPSPVSQEDTVAVPEPSVQVTPKLPLRRKSMKKEASRKTPKGMLKVMHTLSRSSIKGSWADIVKFSQHKLHAVVPAKRMLTKTKAKKAAAVPKPKTPVKKLQGHVSTGHADSPVTVVVGRAHTFINAPGAAPKPVHNLALLKKNMKMDEDLTGIAEIFSTPVNRRRKSAVHTVPKTPPRAAPTSEASVMSTPEETGEMVVSPMTVAKGGRYNKEAIDRLLESDKEASFVGEIPATSDSTEQQSPDLATVVATPEQKPPQPDCLTGVKRIMRTPRQKPEPLEDLRGRLLKTPRQKQPEQPECLTGVKRIMRTPRAPKATEEVGFDGVKELLETPTRGERVTKETVVVCEAQPEGAARVEELFNTCSWPSDATEEEELCEDGPSTTEEEEEEKLSEDGPSTTEEEVKLCEDGPSTTEEEVKLCEDGPSTTEEVKLCEDGPSTTEEEEKLCEDGPSTTEEEEKLCEDGPSTTEEVKLCEDGPSTTEEVKLCEDGPSTTEEEVKQCEDGPSTTEEEEKLCEDGPSTTEEEKLCEDGPSTTEEEEVKLCEDGPSTTEEEEQEEMAQEPEVVSEEKPEDVSCAQGEDDRSDAVESVDEGPGVVSEQPEDCAQGEGGPSDTVEIISLEEEAQEPEGVCEEKPKDASCAQIEDGPSDTVDNDSREDEAKEPAVVCEKQPEDVEARESLQEAPTLKPRKGRTTKPAATEPAEPEVPQRAAALKPRRGKNAKQTSLEQAEPLQENIEATIDEIPPIGDVEPVSDTIAASREEATLKPKRGRNTKKAAVEEAETVQDDAMEVMHDDVESVVSDTVAPPEEAASKPKRGRKSKQVPVKQESVEEAPTEQENAEVLSDEPLPEEEESVPAVTVEKPRRGRKKDAEEKPEAPVRKGRKAAAKPAVVATEDATPVPSAETVEEEVAPVEESLTKQDSEEKPEAPVKTTRGRKVNAAVKDEVPQVTPAKRGRRVAARVDEEVVTISQEPEEKAEPKQEEVQEDEVADVKPAGNPAEEQPEAPVKATRGRKVNAAAVKEEVPQVAPAKRAHRGAARSLQETAEVADIPAEIPAAPVRKGRKAAAAKPAVVATEDATPVPSAETVEEEVAPVEESLTKQDSEEQSEAPVKATRGRKVNAAAVKEEVPQVAPAKRGRKGAAQETAVVETTVPVSESAPLGKQSTVEEADIPAEVPAGPVRKGRKAAAKTAVVATEDATPVPSAETVEEEVAPVEESLTKPKEEVPQVAPAKRGRKGAAQATAAVETTVPVTESAPRGRLGRQSKVEVADDIPAEVPEAPVRKGRKAAVKPAVVATEDATPVSSAETVEEEVAPVEESLTKQDSEEKSEAPVKATRGRKVNAAVKDEVPQVAPAKRGRKAAAQETTIPVTESAPPVKRSKVEVADIPAEVPEAPVRKGRKAAAKPAVVATEDAETVEEEVAPVEEILTKQDSEEKPEAPVKATRGRKVNAAVKDEVPQVAPAKRGRRVAAQETAVVETTVPVSESAPRGKRSKVEEADIPAEVPSGPVKKGRKAAAKTAVVATDDAAEEDVEGTNRSMTAVNWKVDLTETHAVTPVAKAARGRKAKPVEDKDEASQVIPSKRARHSAEPSTPQATASKPANKGRASSKKAEEEDLSVKAEPIASARRGAKVTEEAPEVTEDAPEEGRGKAAPKRGKAASKTVDDVETQPKARRGRAVKK